MRGDGGCARPPARLHIDRSPQGGRTAQDIRAPCRGTGHQNHSRQLVLFECPHFSAAPAPASNQFPIDIWYQRGNIKCNARSGTLRGVRPAKSFASPMQSYTVTHRFLPQQVNPLEFALTKNASASLLECALAKSLDLKAPGINTYKKVGGYPRLRPARSPRLETAPGCLPRRGVSVSRRRVRRKTRGVRWAA